jgi:hypothetical protein
VVGGFIDRFIENPKILLMFTERIVVFFRPTKNLIFRHLQILRVIAAIAGIAGIAGNAGNAGIAVIAGSV